MVPHLRRAVPALLLLAAAAAAQDSGTPTPGDGGGVKGGPPPTSPASPPGGVATQWPAPTEEDWKLPCLVTFQRTWEDALAVSKETNKPILICVSMDGEPASENYAGVRYRRPEHAVLYEPYVCVIASVYRHTPKDHDEAGNRIPCPRFGTVTCGEHIAIEPLLFAKYFDGQRVAPRHICIETDGRETWDVLYANDTASVFQVIRDGIEKRTAKPRPVVRGDRPVLERVASRAVEDRAAVEAAYRAGDAAARRALLEKAALHPDALPLEVLRLALYGADPELAALARKALAAVTAPEAAPLLAEALRAPLDDADRAALLAALDRAGAASSKARWIASVHRGLGGKSDALDVKGWLAGGTYAAAPLPTPALAPEAAEALALAESNLAEALRAREADDGNSREARMFSGLLLVDARNAALKAEAAGAGGWRTKTVLALAAYYEGKHDEAYERAGAALREIPPGDGSVNSMAILTVFAEGRWKAIKAAVAAKKEYPPAWLTDLHACYAVLLKHPRVTDARIAWHHELLLWLGVKEQADRVLREGLDRFPVSPLLHARWRKALLEEAGPDGLARTYEALLAAAAPPRGLPALAAVAYHEAGDQHRRLRRAGPAVEAYERAAEQYRRAAAADPAAAEGSARALALLAAGRARISLQAGDLEKAADALLESFAGAPSAAGALDGLGIAPVETAAMLIGRLKGAKNDALAAKVQAALDALSPEDRQVQRP